MHMVRLTKRDVRLLVKLNASRWLATRQVQALIFPGTDLSLTRRRLRKLAQEGYVRSIRQHHEAEAFHTVGPKGAALLEARGKKVVREQSLPKQLTHFVGINDIRIAVETGGAPVKYFYAAWELGQFEHFRHLIPDAIFSTMDGQRRRFAVEYDCSTESRALIARKVTAYLEGGTSFAWHAVLIICGTASRVRSLAVYLRRMDLPACRFLAAVMADVREAGIYGRVFIDLSGAGTHRIALREVAC